MDRRNKPGILAEANALLSTTLYSLRIVFRYPTNIAWLVMLPLMYAFIGGVMSQIIDVSSVLNLDQTSITFAQYILSGMVVWLFSSASLGLAGSLEVEIAWGTVQSAFSTPTRPTTFLLGLLLAAFLPSLLVTVAVVGYLAAVSGGVRVGTAIVPFCLGLGVYAGIGLLMSAGALRWRRIGQLASLWPFMEQFIAGVLFPVLIIPMPIRILSYAMPTTWAIDLVRAGLLGTPTILPYNTGLALLGALAAVSLLLGSLAVNRALRRVAELGLGDTT